MKKSEWKERREGSATVAELVMEAYFARESCKTDTFSSAAANARKRVYPNHFSASTSSIQASEFSDIELSSEHTFSDSDSTHSSLDVIEH